MVAALIALPGLGSFSVDDPTLHRPLLMTPETIAFRRWLERFGTVSQKAGHLYHTGTVRSSVGEDRIQMIELECDCRAVLGPWRDG